jgi:hypothetical protein
MPWKETCVLNEKTKFVARLMDGDTFDGWREDESSV